MISDAPLRTQLLRSTANAALVALLVVSPASLVAQGPAAPDTITGRIVTDSMRPVAGAMVYVTRSTDRAVEQRTADADGRFSVVFAEGSGDYLVYASAAGFTAARQRVQRTGTERRFTVTLTLRSTSPTQLATVKVKAVPPPPPARAPAFGTRETGASEKWAEGVAGNLAPTVRGDLAAGALTTPGFTSGANGVSLLGAGNALTTLNGAAIPSVQLPRAGNFNARFTGTSFDATRGGFAGANFDVRLEQGNRNIQQKNAFLTLDAAALTATDAVGQALGLPTNAFRASFGADGELIRRAVTYNVAADITRRAAEPATIVSADPATLALAGLGATDVQALRAAATTAGVPFLGANPTRLRENLTVLSRFDDTRDTSRVFAVSTLLSADRRRGLGLAPATAPSAAADQDDVGGALQVLRQRYFGPDRRLFAETRGSLTLSRATGAPAVRLPFATVLLGSGAGSDPTALGRATLGGSPSGIRDESRWIAEAAQEFSWLPTFSTRHLVRGALFARAEGLRDASLDNPFGTVAYNSVADLAANRPAAYARLISQPVRDGRVLNAAGAVSYRWNPGPPFQLLMGARIEHNRALAAPDENPDLQRLGVNNAAVPARWHVSPRIGFTWRPGARGQGLGVSNTNLGTFTRLPSGALRVGVGEFRDLLRPDLLALASGATGISGSTLGLSCVGLAVPTINWALGAGAAPNACATGAGPQALRAGAVQYLDRSWDVARSWRASASWSQDLKPFILRLEAMGALNLNQPSVVDANFNGVSQFMLPGEQRPMWVPAAAVDPASGAVNSTQSRRDAAFGAVRGLRSDGRSQGGLLTASLQVDQWATESNVYANVSYTLQSLRQRFRGFDGAGVGNPAVFEWARATDDARHTVVVEGGMPIRRGNTTLATLTMFARLQSGLPFTPVVQGDLDGDGVPGDRAFLPNGSSPLASDIASLGAALPSRVRACLDRQRGRVAARNSCEGPWAVSTNVRLDVEAASALLGRRTSLALNLSNPLALADRLVNGDNLKGWGGPAFPDPVLLVPRGFDANAQAFRYSVNPRFGDTRPGRTLLRNPFVLSVDVSINLTRDPVVQQLERAIEPPGRGAFVRPSADTVLARYMENVSSIHQSLLDNADTLFLTRAQIEASYKADTVFRDEARALLRPLAEYLATLPEKFDALTAKARVDSTEKRYQELFWRQRTLAQERLTPLQRSALPRWIQVLFATRLEDNWERWPRYVFRGGSVSVSRN